MNRPHTLSSIAAEAMRDKRTVQLWLKKHHDKTGKELGALAPTGTRYFSDAERDVLLSYRAAESPRFIRQDEEIKVSESVAIAIPENFSPVVAAEHFDGAIAQVTDPNRILQLAEAMLSAAESVLDTKIVQQKQDLRQHETALTQVQRLRTDKLTDIKIKASESRMLAEQQNSATQNLQSELARISQLGKQEDQQ